MRRTVFDLRGWRSASERTNKSHILPLATLRIAQFPHCIASTVKVVQAALRS